MTYRLLNCSISPWMFLSRSSPEASLLPRFIYSSPRSKSGRHRQPFAASVVNTTLSCLAGRSIFPFKAPGPSSRLPLPRYFLCRFFANQEERPPDSVRWNSAERLHDVQTGALKEDETENSQKEKKRIHLLSATDFNL